ncbi:isocitrate/isopropylmalate family dehydrogenase, partial [Luminiphilus sp.]|nr:isocitrate/isopropylmalate family dehydrogenase [Luminiphilus sp.]
MAHDILLLPGDGIGPEVVSQARRVLETASKQFTIDINFEAADLGGVAIDNHGV